ncbi:MAG: PH domain-containing protein [Hyphomicrobiaceae bacterium]|nr:PH domain-containing protein [Hyphomicrobiaceae bacterium]
MNPLNELPHDAVQTITAETQGEIIRWTGRPNPRSIFWSATPAWLMGIPWLALSGGMFGAMVHVALFGKANTAAMNGWGPAALGIAIVFVSAFVLIGLAMVGAPFWAWAKSRRMIYVITDKRLIRIGWDGRTKEVASWDPARIVSLLKRERRDGSGTLTVTTLVYQDSDGDKSKDVEILAGVPNVAAAERLLREKMDGRNGGASGGGAPLHRDAPRDKAA